MATIEIYPRKPQWLPPLLASICCVCMGAGIIFLSDSKLLIMTIGAWFFLGLGLLGLITVPKAFRQQSPNPTLILSLQGIHYVPTPFGLVPWDEIVHVGLRKSGLVIAVHNNLPYFAALPLLQRCAWWSGLTLPGDLLLIRRESIEMELESLLSLICKEWQDFEQRV